jgi:hypothetical protein
MEHNSPTASASATAAGSDLPATSEKRAALNKVINLAATIAEEEKRIEPNPRKTCNRPDIFPTIV